MNATINHDLVDFSDFFQTMKQNNYKYSEITEKIIGCAMAVHRELGNGFPEIIYQRALAIELELAEINFKCEFEMPIYYRGHLIGKRRADFLVENLIPLEIKATTKLEDIHLAQAMNYLEAYNLEVGLLLNFGERSLQFKRVHNKKYTH